MEERLKAAVKLILSLHEHPEANAPGYFVKLDPKTVEQLNRALEPPMVTNVDISQFDQFDQVTEYEEFFPCEVTAIEDGMLVCVFDCDGEDELCKFPPKVTNSDFHNPITHEVVTADQAKPGFICRSLLLKEGVGDLLGFA